MSYRKKIFLFLFVLPIIWVVLLIGPICRPDVQNAYICRGEWINQIGDASQALFLFPLIFAFLALIFLFTPERAYNTWKKFALAAIPLSAIWIATTPVNCGGGFGLSLCFDKEAITWLASGLFLGISLIIILVSSLQKKSS